VTARDQVLRLVRRARRRLEFVRLAKAASQGALAGTALGLLSLFVERGMLPWAFLAAGAVAGFVVALLRPPIGSGDAALYLDRRLGTAERFATVATRPPDPLTIRVAEELAHLRRLPRSPVPREAALVPLALFLLFAAGLLPAPREEASAAAGFVVVAAEEGGSAAEADPATLERLARGERLTPREAELLREAIERGVRRPEERRAANAALDRAAKGEGASGAEVLEALKPRATDVQGAALLASAYPDAEEFVRAYRRALEEDRQ
jgi:hypothetical protein